MEFEDYIPALTIWREARGEGPQGMLAVAWVIKNRMAKRNLSAYAVCLQPWQFSSMTAHGDPELAVWPTENDAQFEEARDAWEEVFADKATDLTHGADFYFADTLAQMPSWASAYTPTVTIGHHKFYRS